MTAFLVRSDARKPPLKDQSVDLLITSPPYFSFREYQDAGGRYEGQIGNEATPEDFIDALIECVASWIPIMKPTGSIVVNLGDKRAGSGGANNRGLSKKGPRGGPGAYNKASGKVKATSLMLLPERFRIAAVDQLGLICRDVLYWHKLNGLPDTTKSRFRAMTEDFVRFTLLPGAKAYSNMYAIAKSYSDNSHLRFRTSFSESVVEGGTRRWSSESVEAKPEGVIPDNVISMVNDGFRAPAWLGLDHTAAFPQEWPRLLIEAFAPQGGVVWDPFGGTGTVAMVARKLERTGINCDLSADYLRLARWRIFQSSDGNKSLAKSWGERQGELL